MLRRINQPATEPMEAVLPEYLALECKFLNFTSFSHCLDRFPILGAGQIQLENMASIHQ